MNGINEDDIEFLDVFLSNDLTDENLKELDKRIKDPGFKKYYKKRLNQKFTSSPRKLFFDYLPMLLLIGLTIIGIYLILIKM